MSLSAVLDETRPGPTPLGADALLVLRDELAGFLGDRVTDSAAAREHHSQDEGHRSGQTPDLVVFPESTEEVAQVMAAAGRAGCPVTTWGAGTSLEGNALAAHGGLILNLSRMDRILDVRPEDLTVTVQAGVRRKQLNTDLRDTGLFFPIDPGADATLGGMAATRASGTNAVKYGTMRDNVLSCVAVTATGEILHTARRAPKSAAGYDLTALLVGSEGTLAVITEVTVRLYPVPEQVFGAVAVFDSIEQAVRAVIFAIQMGIDIGKIEFLDAPMMAAINKAEKMTLDEAPTLFFELQGSPAVVEDGVGLLMGVLEEFGGRVTNRATAPEERSALWRARHNALYAAKALTPGGKVLITDVCVPISRLADCLLQTRADLDASWLTSTIAGHVGDGNFHCFIVLDPDRPEDTQEAERLHHLMARRAIAMEGTCTGEHGIGQGKRDLLEEELGDALPMMRAIKAALDPKGLMNPGKIFS
jgi:D-lactate dehydrogenase (cytochrome)